MSDPFASPKRRLARAKHNRTEIETISHAFFETKPYTHVIERNARGFDEYKVRLTAEIPDEITDLTIEVIEALRSVLDQAVHPIAVACHARRPDLIHFPIADTAADFENVLNGSAKDLPADILTLFRSFKPYKSGNESVWALNRIRRESSHRLIVPVGTATLIGPVKVSVCRPVPLTVPPLRWDSEKSEIIFAIAGPGAELEYEIEITLFIAFGPVEAMAGEPLLTVLDEMTAEVERILFTTEAEAKRLGLV